jgi:hypothetical protein
LEEIIDEKGNPVTGHSWFSLTRGFKALTLEHGDYVMFVAKVVEYSKGYKGKPYASWKRKHSNVMIDYGFSHPVSVTKVTEEVWAQRRNARQGLGNAQDSEAETSTSSNNHLLEELA